jgi:hypothetical protein
MAKISALFFRTSNILSRSLLHDYLLTVGSSCVVTRQQLELTIEMLYSVHFQIIRSFVNSNTRENLNNRLIYLTQKLQNNKYTFIKSTVKYFDLRKEAETGSRKTMINEELHNLYYLPNTIAGGTQKARMRGIRSAYVLVRKTEKKVSFGKVRVYGRKY